MFGRCGLLCDAFLRRAEPARCPPPFTAGRREMESVTTPGSSATTEARKVRVSASEMESASEGEGEMGNAGMSKSHGSEDIRRLSFWKTSDD